MTDRADAPLTQDRLFDTSHMEVEGVTLAGRFVMPPFTVLDTRQGPWQSRKRQWHDLGISSDDGRDASPFTKRKGLTDVDPDTLDIVSLRIMNVGTVSVFDPVLCELIYRWFAPPGGTILDPFAGGSVRGIVAGILGYRYTGIDLRPEQVEANYQQSATIHAAGRYPTTPATDSMPTLTPTERHGGHYVKRDDTFTIAGAGHGGKVRTCWTLACKPDVQGLITAGSRQSPQVGIVAGIAAKLGLPCRVHVPSGPYTPELEAAAAAGAEVIQHTPGYNSVIVARARQDATESGWTEIPFGMECPEAVYWTSTQTENLPTDIDRIVVPVGSGMSLAGICAGLDAANNPTPILAVQVGADPTDRLDRYAPVFWRQRVELVQSPLDYHTPAPHTHLDDLPLDPIYEAKCLPYLEDGDLLWVVGRRQTIADTTAPTWHVADSQQMHTVVGDERYDLVMSCPPYHDLERYSDDPADLSNMGYAEFVDAYRTIIGNAIARLKNDRFAVFVVSEIRGPAGKGGLYRNFVADTIAAFEDAGAAYYNEAVLVNTAASTGLRAARAFTASRKLGRCHQTVLVFVKGDPKKATAAMDPTVMDTLLAAGYTEPDYP